MDYLQMLQLESKLKKEFESFEKEKLETINRVSELIRSNPDNLEKINNFIKDLSVFLP